MKEALTDLFFPALVQARGSAFGVSPRLPPLSRVFLGYRYESASCVLDEAGDNGLNMDIDSTTASVNDVQRSSLPSACEPEVKESALPPWRQQCTVPERFSSQADPRARGARRARPMLRRWHAVNYISVIIFSLWMVKRTVMFR
jgi:hypothetical protein